MKVITARMEGKAVALNLDGLHVWLTEDETRRLRAEINRCLQRIAEGRRART